MSIVPFIAFDKAAARLLWKCTRSREQGLWELFHGSEKIGRALLTIFLSFCCSDEYGHLGAFSISPRNHVVVDVFFTVCLALI